MSSENWYKVDNVAKVFLATHNERDTRSLRVSCTLKEPVNPDLLQEALITTIKRRPLFQVRIRRGLFWHYLETTDVMPKVAEEHQRPCPVLYGKNYTGTLHYSVTYFHNRINVELFHALSDGTGALEFLNILVQNYLRLKYPNEMKNVTIGLGASADDLAQDSFKKFYTRNAKAAPSVKKSYHIHGRKLPYDQLQFFEVSMPSKDLLELSKQYQVSLSSLIGAKLMMAIYDDMSALKRKQPVTISMPVNLRNYYPSETSRNFFNNISISHIFTGDETLESLAKEYDAKLKNILQPEQIRRQMDYYQLLEHIFFIRMVPLFIKQPVVKFFSKKENKRVSAVISNLGVMNIPTEMQQHVEKYSAFCSHNELFMTICSYQDEMTLGITSGYRNTGVLKNFVRSFSKEGIPVQLQATEVVKS